MFDSNKRAAILELHKQGHALRFIARLLKASRIAVRRVIRSGTAEVAGRVRCRMAEQYRTQILELWPANLFQTEHTDLSELAPLLDFVTNGILRERKKAATILARKAGWPNMTIAKILHVLGAILRVTLRFIPNQAYKGFSLPRGRGNQGSRAMRKKRTKLPSQRLHPLRQAIHKKDSGMNRGIL